jgi:hypothetical protein
MIKMEEEELKFLKKLCQQQIELLNEKKRLCDIIDKKYEEIEMLREENNDLKYKKDIDAYQDYPTVYCFKCNKMTYRKKGNASNEFICLDCKTWYKTIEN